MANDDYCRAMIDELVANLVVIGRRLERLEVLHQMSGGNITIIEHEKLTAKLAGLGRGHG